MTPEQVRQIVLDNTGGCHCDKAYTERGLEDPICVWHQHGLGIIEDLTTLIEESTQAIVPMKLEKACSGFIHGPHLWYGEESKTYWICPGIGAWQEGMKTQ